jgi:hypothetical protein
MAITVAKTTVQFVTYLPNDARFERVAIFLCKWMLQTLFGLPTPKGQFALDLLLLLLGFLAGIWGAGSDGICAF